MPDDSTEFDAPVWTPPPSQKTIILKLDEDGNLKPLSERMQGRLREFASREDWTTATGLGAGLQDDPTVDRPKAPFQLVDDDKAKAILKGLESMKQMCWSLIGLSEAKRTEIVRYSEAQKDLLAPPIARVINKRSPDWMRKYWDEVQLALFMGTIEIGQFQLCAKALVEEKKAAQRRAGPQAVREMPREPRAEQRETQASAEAQAEVQVNGEMCSFPKCTEPAVPGMAFCRVHRTAVEA